LPERADQRMRWQLARHIVRSSGSRSLPAGVDLGVRAIECRARGASTVERLDGERYVRSVAHDGELGTIEIVHVPARDSLGVTIRFPSVRALPAILARVRRVFDLGADVTRIGGPPREEGEGKRYIPALAIEAVRQGRDAVQGAP
jgi:hypothetical protein